MSYRWQLASASETHSQLFGLSSLWKQTKQSHSRSSRIARLDGWMVREVCETDCSFDSVRVKHLQSALTISTPRSKDERPGTADSFWPLSNTVLARRFIRNNDERFLPSHDRITGTFCSDEDEEQIQLSTSIHHSANVSVRRPYTNPKYSEKKL